MRSGLKQARGFPSELTHYRHQRPVFAPHNEQRRYTLYPYRISTLCISSHPASRLLRSTHKKRP